MKRTILLVFSLLLCVSGAQAIQTISDSCSGTTSCTLAGAHSAGDLIIWWAYRAGSLTAPTGATGTLVTTSSSSVGASRSWRMNCSVAVAGSIASGTWTNATNMGAVAITGTSATTTANCATDAVGSKGTPNNVSSATATYAAVTMAAGAQSIGLAVMGSSTSGNTCTPTSATVVAGATTGDVRVSLANAQGNWASTTCAITSSVTTEFVVEVKATIVATPTFSPNGGTFGTSVSETLSDTTGGASICYTTDGSTPAAATAGTCSAGSTYSSPFSVATDASTVKALGTAAALANSAVATSSTFTINPFLPSLALLGVSGPAVTGLGVDSTACASGPSSCPKGSGLTTGTTVTTNSFSTGTNVALIAFVTGDVAGNLGDVSGIVTAGVTWIKVISATGATVSNGFTSIWRAQSSAALSAVTAVATMTSCTSRTIYVVPFSGSDLSGTNGSAAIGANNKFGGASGAPTGSITTTRNGSWVWGVLLDWSADATPAIGSNQTQQNIVHNAGNGDSFWVQSQTATTPASGTSVTINDTAPTADNWDLAMVEVLPAP